MAVDPRENFCSFRKMNCGRVEDVSHSPNLVMKTFVANFKSLLPGPSNCFCVELKIRRWRFLIAKILGALMQFILKQRTSYRLFSIN